MCRRRRRGDAYVARDEPLLAVRLHEIRLSRRRCVRLRGACGFGLGFDLASGFSFGFGFGTGLWGLLEIAVFGLLSLVSLRIACEALLVWFKAHEQSGDTVNRSRYSASLLDEVREAIRDLAEEGDELDYAEADEYITPATESAPYVAPAGEAPRAPATASGEVFKPRRTAKRTPPPKGVT